MLNLSQIHYVYLNNLDYCSNRPLLQPCSCFNSVDGLQKVDELVRGKFGRILAVVVRLGDAILLIVPPIYTHLHHKL